jgi:hypothetical protein
MRRMTIAEKTSAAHFAAPTMTTPAENPARSRLPILTALALSLVLVLTSGCQRDRDAGAYGHRFPADDEVRPVDRFVHVQSASAARADATLNDAHFDGRGALNSLGRQKLDYMLRDDDAAAPLVVYLDVRDGGAAQATPSAEPSDLHRESVRVFLADRGLTDAQMELRAGPNLAYSHPARDGLRGLKHLEGAGAAPDAAPGAAAKSGLMSGAGSK